MNRSVWQLTKRRWAIVFTEPAVYIAFAITVVAFAALGPFGTFSDMPITERIGFWFLVHLVSWIIATLIIVPVRFTLERFGVPVFPAFVIGSFSANLVIAPVFIWILAENTNAAIDAAKSFGLFAVAAAIISLVTYITLRFTGIETIPVNLHDKREWSHEAEMATISTTDDAVAHLSDNLMLQKLPPEKRGVLYAMIAHDHYVEVVTDKGRHLVLMRLTDAIDLSGKCDGLRVHRSGWVARRGIADVIVKARRMWIALPDGSMVTVSRQYQDEVRAFRNVGTGSSSGETILALSPASTNQ